MHTKDFQGWHTLKQNLDKRQSTSVPTIKEREIWWCSIGVNVGDEEEFFIFSAPTLNRENGSGGVANAKLYLNYRTSVIDCQ